MKTDRKSAWWKTMIDKHGSREAVFEFMRQIGGEGGKSYNRETSPPKGFAADLERASLAGVKGGRISRRKKA
jgi:general stress protein YciG